MATNIGKMLPNTIHSQVCKYLKILQPLNILGLKFEIFLMDKDFLADNFRRFLTRQTLLVNELNSN